MKSELKGKKDEKTAKYVGFLVLGNGVHNFVLTFSKQHVLLILGHCFV